MTNIRNNISNKYFLLPTTKAFVSSMTPGRRHNISNKYLLLSYTGITQNMKNRGTVYYIITIGNRQKISNTSLCLVNTGITKNMKNRATKASVYLIATERRQNITNRATPPKAFVSLITPERRQNEIWINNIVAQMKFFSQISTAQFGTSLASVFKVPSNTLTNCFVTINHIYDKESFLNNIKESKLTMGETYTVYKKVFKITSKKVN